MPLRTMTLLLKSMVMELKLWRPQSSSRHCEAGQSRGEQIHSMNIGIVGAGAIGSYYAAILQRAGHVVRLLARGHHLTAIREHGLVLRTPGEEVTVRVTAGTDVSVLDGAEYVLVAVKSYTLRDVADTLPLCARRGAK